MAVIDVDRGVMIRENVKFGMNIYMYIDEPGIYLTAHGLPASEDMARDAGFDVVTLGKAREKRERMDKAMAAIELEVEGKSKEEVIYKVGDLRVVDYGMERYRVTDDEGSELHKEYLGKDAAKGLADQLAGTAPAKPVKK